MNVFVGCLLVNFAVAIRIGEDVLDLSVDTTNSSLLRGNAPEGQACCCKEVSKKTEQCTSGSAKLTRDPKGKKTLCCKYKVETKIWSAFTKDRCPTRVYSGYHKMYDDSYCPTPTTIEEDMLAISRSNLAAAQPNEACIRASVMDSSRGLGSKSIFGNACPATALKERQKFNLGGVSILCCRCPPGSIWNNMMKMCKCKAGVDKGQQAFPDATTRKCPTADEVMGGAQTQIDIMRLWCELHRSLEEFLPPNEDQVFRMGLGEQMVLSIDDLMLTDIDLTVKFAQSPSGTTIEFADKSEEGKQSTLTLTLKNLHLAVVVGGLRVPVTIGEAVAVVALSGKDVVDDILTFGSPNKISLRLLEDLQLSGNTLSSAVNVVGSLPGLKTMVQDLVLNQVAGGIVTKLFSTIGFLASGADWPSQIKTLFDRRSPLPSTIHLFSTPDVECQSDKLCISFAIKSGRAEKLEELGHSELLEAGIEPRVVTFNGQTTPDGDIAAVLTIDVGYDVSTGLRTVSEWTFQSLYNEAAGIKEQVQAKRKQLDGTMEVTMDNYKCKEPRKDEAQSTLQQAASVGVSVATGTGSVVGGAFSLGFRGLGWVTDQTAGRAVAYFSQYESLPREPGPDRADFEERIWRIWQNSNPDKVGFMFRSVNTGAGMNNEPDFHIYSIVKVQTNLEAMINAQEMDSGVKGLRLQANVDITDFRIKGIQCDVFNKTNYAKLMEAEKKSKGGVDPDDVTDVQRAIWSVYTLTGYGEVFTNNGLELIVDKVSVEVESTALEGFATRSCVNVGDLTIRLEGSRMASVISVLPAMFTNQLKNLAKDQIEGALGPLMEQVILVAGDFLKTSTILVKLEPTGGQMSFTVRSAWQELGIAQLKSGAVPASAMKTETQDVTDEEEDTAVQLGDAWLELAASLQETLATPVLSQSWEPLSYEPSVFLAGGAINNMIPALALEATARMSNVTVAPVQLGGSVVLNLKQTLFPILNDHGAWDLGHWLSASESTENTNNATVLSCGSVYVMPTQTTPEEGKLLYKKGSHKSKYSMKIPVKDLQRSGHCFEAQGQKLCYRPDSPFKEVLEAEIQRETKIVPEMITSLGNKGSPWEAYHCPTKNMPFRWEGGGGEVASLCKDHVDACATHLPCAGVGYAVGTSKNGCYFLSVLDVEQLNGGAPSTKCVNSICVGALVMAGEGAKKAKGVVYEVNQAGEGVEACLRDEFKLRAGIVETMGCFDSNTLEMVSDVRSGMTETKVMTKVWAVGPPETWGFTPRDE
eukprot:TRINITY_DN23805_c0_g3_i1.p1 TRINITY_DN23805_c0_g3~~TRINITY_DN23805_c0_g3_i1.p1  ORF type:complete len:1261 (-),score=199.16 TRINITY_DN23805_c0_g3_i1:248-4030(-)